MDRLLNTCFAELTGVNDSSCPELYCIWKSNAELKMI